MTYDTDRRLYERIAELEKALGEVRQTHLEVEDCWYSCPKSAEGCCNESMPKGQCGCGADRANEIIDKALGISSVANTANTQTGHS